MKKGKVQNVQNMESSCQKPIYRKCITKYHLKHRKHEITDIEDANKEILAEKIGPAIHELERKKQDILKVKAARDNEKCIRSLEGKMEEHVRLIKENYEKLIEIVVQMKTKTQKQIVDNVAAIDYHLYVDLYIYAFDNFQQKIRFVWHAFILELSSILY